MTLKCACDPLQNHCEGKTMDFCLSNHTCFKAVIKKSHGQRDINNNSRSTMVGATTTTTTTTITTMGCLDDLEHSQMTCRVGSKETAAILCCNSGHFCNRNLDPQLSSSSPSSSSSSSGQVSRDALGSTYGGSYLQEIVYAPLGFMLLALFAVTLFCFVHSKGKLKNLRGWNLKAAQAAAATSAAAPSSCDEIHSRSGGGDLKIVQIGDSTLKGLLERSSTSGSGSGAPMLAQRTVSWSVQLLEIIGRGRFAHVWRGVYQDEPVAVKIFSSHAEAAWTRECGIFKTVLLRHENVLAFVAADTVSRLHSCTQLWLITRYHENGSLYDYLNAHPVTKQEMFDMLLSAAAGLVHLHTTIVGSQGKPGIAHRDIKSKNILVMSNKKCCIADLGLALVETRFETFRCNQSSSGNQYGLSGDQTCPSAEAIELRVGTKRYMSPEVLDGSMDVENFDSFKKSDVYSFGLVTWEACKRCLVDGKCDDYELPYCNMVPGDPSYEEMSFIVCRSRARPPPAQSWSGDKTLMNLYGLMEECWSPYPEVRHSMLRLKKSISKLSEQEISRQTPGDPRAV